MGQVLQGAYDGLPWQVAAAGAPLVKVLAQGTTVPAKWQQAVARGDTGQTGICLEVFERGDDQDDSQATLLARVSGAKVSFDLSDTTHHESGKIRVGRIE